MKDLCEHELTMFVQRIKTSFKVWMMVKKKLQK